ncbi:metal-dependent hydrolase [Cytobacillus depressus]|uniref:Metal-dependent hydrolase n=1 Tax=Cytobacillus depressus TaxID=1602942 RepID=A0A6L3V3T1_9BACI|nr:metal-dependent hydrolase [Cytobacillus depressus]KAB2332302.1 metal-dependent hydrolase [Cytobacillus depressus]
MNGTSHTVIGATVGFLTANMLQTNPSETILLVGVGAISGLMPDVDTDGKLSNKITISYKTLRTAAQFFAFLMIFYSFFTEVGMNKWIGIGIGILILIFNSFITQRRMLTITGVGILFGGLFIQEAWLWMLGIFIIVASFVPHRSYTHSLLGVLGFGYISYQLEASLGQNGVFYACLFGYISHLIADMKGLPFNKRGVKFFLPFSKKEF